MMRMIKNLIIVILLAISPYCWCAVVTDTSRVSKQTTLIPSTNSGDCAYFASDTYGGTEGIPSQGGALVTDGSNNLNLGWTNGGSSSLNTPVKCNGTYQIFFTLQMQAASNNSAIRVGYCVKTNDGATVYGSCPASSSNMNNSFVFNPKCNGGDYCPVRTFPFTANIHLNAGQYVTAPSLNTSAQTALAGGEFIVLYIGP